MAQSCVVHLARPVTDIDRWLFLLDDGEVERMRRFRLDIDKARFVTGRAIAKTVLAERLDTDAADIRFILTCLACGDDPGREPHGKPTVDGAEFSIAHSGELVAVAVATVPVGVDVELVNDRTEVESMAEAVLTAPEQGALRGAAAPRPAFFTYWARKEALVKSTGMGLSTPMTSVTVSAPDAAPEVLDWRDGPAAVWMSDLDLSAYTGAQDYRGTVAAVTSEPVELEYQHFAG